MKEWITPEYEYVFHLVFINYFVGLLKLDLFFSLNLKSFKHAEILANKVYSILDTNAKFAIINQSVFTFVRVCLNLKE